MLDANTRTKKRSGKTTIAEAIAVLPRMLGSSALYRKRTNNTFGIEKYNRAFSANVMKAHESIKQVEDGTRKLAIKNSRNTMLRVTTAIK